MAKKEGKSQSWVDQHLRFGRFLEWCSANTTAGGDTDKLSERRFRENWSQTDRKLKEGARFEQVVDLIEGKIKPIKPTKKQRPINAASDGKADTVASEFKGASPQEYKPAVIQSLLTELAQVGASVEPEAFVRQCSSEKRELVLSHVDTTSKWLARVAEALERAKQ